MSASLEQPDGAGAFHPVPVESHKLTQPECLSCWRWCTALGVRRRTPATTTAKSACTPRPPSNCCLSRRLVAPADAHRHYPMRVSINLPLGVSVLLMPASAAFSVVAEGSNFTTCGVDLWFESRAWVLPLRPIPLRCSGTRGFVICYVKWTGLLLRNERRDTDTGSATPAHCTFSAALHRACSPRPTWTCDRDRPEPA